MEKDYKKDLEIDKFALDEMCVMQPSIYYKHSEAYTEALDKVNRLKLQLEELKAVTDRDVRLVYASRNTKVTESVIARDIALTPKVRKLQEECLIARQEANTLQNLKEALGQKKDSIRDLVNLYQSNYFSTVEGKEEKKLAIKGAHSQLKKRKRRQ